MTWRNRIVGHGEVDPEELVANPLNFRIHPAAQQSALEGVLDEIGWVGDVMVSTKSGFVVDGHARVVLALRRGEKVPVRYVDLTAKEEALILAAYDPIAAMATTDAAKLDELLRGVDTGSAAVQAMLADLAQEANLYAAGMDDAPPPDEFKEFGEDIETEHECPKCGYRWSGGQ